MQTFAVTDNAEVIGSYSWDGHTWQWSGDRPSGPVIANRTMNRHRRAAYLTAIGLPAEASPADELTLTWGIRATDGIEFVPIPANLSRPVAIPVRGDALDNGATVEITDGTATCDRQPVAGLPRSIGVLASILGGRPLTATVEARGGGRTFLIARVA